MNTDLLKSLALRSAGGAAGGAALGGYVAPEGSRLEGAGVGALAGGLAGAGSVALGHGATPATPRSYVNTAPPPTQAMPHEAPAVDAMRQAMGLSGPPAPAPRAYGTAAPPAAPATSHDMPSPDAMRQAMGLDSKPAPGSAEHLGQYVEDLLTHKKTAAYLAGQHTAAAALGLEKEAWAPLVAAGARMAPTLLRAGRSLMGGNMGNAAKGVQAAARGGWNTFAKQAPRTAAGLQTAGRVAANPMVQTGAMIAAS